MKPSLATHMGTHLLLLCIFSLLSLPFSAAKVSYEDHCSSVVPASIPTGVIADGSQRRSLRLPNGYCSVDRKILSSKTANSSSTFTACTFDFADQQIHETREDSVLQVAAMLQIYRSGSSSFRLMGFWSISTGKICMVGSGHSRYDHRFISVVVKLNYPSLPNISTILVSGTVESLEADADGLFHFENMSLLAYNGLKSYQYTLVNQANESCSALKLEEEEEGTLAIGSVGSECFYLSYYMNQGLYITSHTENGCNGGACLPLATGNGSLVRYVSLNSLKCSHKDRKLHFSIHALDKLVNSNTSLSKEAPLLVAEGFWHQKRNRVCAVACPILEDKASGDAYVGDCTIGFSLWFPAARTLKNRSTVVGRMWSNFNKSDKNGHFDMVSFKDAGNLRGATGTKYIYTYDLAVMDKFCKPNREAKIGKRRLYPDGGNIGDMQFQMYVKNDKGNETMGYATVISIGDTYYGSNGFEPIPVAAAIRDVDSDVDLTVMADTRYRQIVWNISYEITFMAPSTIFSITKLDAEGIYSSSTGKLCMVGCRNINQGSRLSDSNTTSDCQVSIDVQFAPLNQETGVHVSGTIVSTRKNSDPLYFEPLEISSYGMYRVQAEETIRRMNTEVAIVISSLTLLCMCIVVQLRHGKKNPSVLPSISMTMLVVLALGHMIPLVLNFETTFFAARRAHRSALFISDGWLEANEVVVRILTMIAFLLQCRLLQMGFSARLTDQDSNKGLWSAEKASLLICFPLYIAGGLVTWLVVHNSMLGEVVVDEMISYAGLVMDGFLLPQIVLNLYRNSKEKTLSPFFYVGITAVRVLPHLYDMYRSRHYVQIFYTYIFSGPGGDFYSPAWDVIIPCVGVLFALLLFLQQRFGGQCILPTRCGKCLLSAM